jgi:hypothetical protein
MHKIALSLLHFFSLVAHCLILFASIAKTFVKRAYLKIRKIKIEHPHLQSFIEKRKKSGCNLNTLFDSLEEQSDPFIKISDLVKRQESYTSKDELLKSLPPLEKETEIIAIPLAISAFFFFRHFVTLIIDQRDGIIEFYDPIGFTISNYKNGFLWGPQCKKGSHLTLTELFSFIKEKYQISKVIENKKMHQTDFNQCALFVYDRIYKRGPLRFSAKKASQSPMSSSQAFI